eukprot:11210175-Lingulodinium_polyedra.AAC.1
MGPLCPLHTHIPVQWIVAKEYNKHRTNTPAHFQPGTQYAFEVGQLRGVEQTKQTVRQLRGAAKMRGTR